LPELGSVPEFALTASDGRTFSSAELHGKVWVADFVFSTCNGPCPRMSALMRRVQDRILRQAGLLDKVRLISVSIDPTHDTPAVLAEYARRFRADARVWLFLTGSEEGVRKLSVDTFHVNTANEPLVHATRFILIDTRGRIRGYYESTDPATLDQLMTDIGALRKEAN
jgi:protein SCO1/2